MRRECLLWLGELKFGLCIVGAMIITTYSFFHFGDRSILSLPRRKKQPAHQGVYNSPTRRKKSVSLW